MLNQLVKWTPLNLTTPTTFFFFFLIGGLFVQRGSTLVDIFNHHTVKQLTMSLH